LCSAGPWRGDQPSRGLPSRSSRFGVTSRERRLVSRIFASWNQLDG
jgi:hypothetical protein